MRSVRLFVSSPHDVAVERERVKYVVEGLNRQFANITEFKTVLWEDQYYSAHISTQRQIAEAADCDIVVAIFWKLLGTPLPASFPPMPNGLPWPSGTAYEILTAIEARNSRQATRPDIYIFEKRQKPTFEEHELASAQLQLQSLRDFLAELRRKNGGGVKTFEDTADFAGQLEKLLRDWLESNVTQGRKILIWPSDRGSPFRGLAVFDRKHADVFFGRSRRTMRAIDELKGAARERVPFLLIVGPSGSGKSSLMRAGLTPLLTAPGVVPEVSRWRTTVLNAGWAGKPFEALAKALLVSGGSDDDPGGFGPALPELGSAYRVPDVLARVLASAGDADEIEAQTMAAAAANMIVDQLDEAAQGERERAGFDPNAPVRLDLLLLVDQLEEIFAATVTEQQRTGFVRLVQAMVDTRRIWIVATLRADFFDRMILFRPLFALKDKGAAYELGPPGESELTEIVQRSADAAGLSYGIDPTTGTALDELILEDAVGGDSLPLLEFTLNELYDKRAVIDGKTYLTVEAYYEMGRLDGAINSAAERAIDNLSESRKAALPRLLTSLVVSVRDKDEVSAGEHWRTSRLVPTDEAAPDDDARALVKALLDNRILLAFHQYSADRDVDAVLDPAQKGQAPSSDNLSGTPVAVLRIAHERVLRSWQLAKDIIASHEDFIRIRDEVEDQRRKWEANKRASPYLIISSYALHDAEQNLNRFGALLSPEIRDFILASLRHARFERRKKQAGIIGLIAATVIAVIAGVVAVVNARQARESYRTALDMIGTFTGSVLGDLRERGVSIGVVGQVLQTAEQGIDRLRQQRGADLDLDRTDGTLLFEFGKTYQFAQEGARAWENAKKSVQLRNRLIAVDAANPRLQWQLSDSLELYGDLLRSERQDFSAARQNYEKVLLIRNQFPATTPQLKAIGLSQIYVRLGDLDLAQKWSDRAREDYRRAFAVMREVMLEHPGDRQLEHELSWDYNKLSDAPEGGSSAARARQALQYLNQSLCLRRDLAYHGAATAPLADPLNSELLNTALRDVTWTLDRMAVEELDLNDRSSGQTHFENSLGLRKYLSDRDVSNVLYLSDLAISESNMAKLYAGDVTEALLKSRPSQGYDLAVALRQVEQGGRRTEDEAGELKLALSFAQASLNHRRGLLVGAIPSDDAPPCTPGASLPQSVSKQNWIGPFGYCNFQPLFEQLCASQGMSKSQCVRDTSWQPIVADRERTAYERWNASVAANDACIDGIMRELAVDKPGDQAANALPQ
jgi:eukaryotic-like serine/threonine-protein kinase